MANWIWYPGDFEIYHGMCQNFDREERGFFWPAYWKIADCRHNLKFTATYQLEKETQFYVAAIGQGHVSVKWERVEFESDPLKRYVKYVENKYRFGDTISCPVGTVTIDVFVGNMNGLPCIFVEGDEIHSDSTWSVTDLAVGYTSIGYNKMYENVEQNPMVFEFTSQMCKPVALKEVNGGILYDFGKEITAETVIHFSKELKPLTLCYGESVKEALDVEKCYLKQYLQIANNLKDFGAFESQKTFRTKLRAFRYIYVPEAAIASEITLEADFKFVDFPHKSSFSCSDDLINQIWKVSEETLRLSSGIFFIDGIKRDRWIWSGDAYQSYFINQYSFYDEDISKRTILALRGNDPVEQHINTILDYSMYWIISLENHYKMSGDLEFIKMVYPKMESMMRYCMNQLDEHGFIYGREEDWVFIDWADIDKEGTNCAEQMLLARSYQAMISIRKLLRLDTREFDDLFYKLKKNIRTFFWDKCQGAFIDSYTSGRKKVSRHSNIFAVLFEYTDEEETENILNNVLLNDRISAITTPYFKFYELEVMAKLGQYDIVLQTMKSYWGGMLERGATTFWEEFKPNETEDTQYGMYGDPYGKSLCHAWGASPIYLIGRYLMGLRSTSTAYQTFEIAPHVNLFDEFECELPLNQGKIKLACHNKKLSIYTDKEGGILKIGQIQWVLEKGNTLIVQV
ncbi:MAG: alpha-rhamnosidase [Vallitaleaceae bacterium]|nr:alpha-rhamnosidase [Vallitaleaceae bacterium]